MDRAEAIKAMKSLQDNLGVDRSEENLTTEVATHDKRKETHECVSETHGDLISRQAAIEVLTRAIRDKFTLDDWYERLLETGVEIEDLIKELPPVTPTEKQEHGRLIDADYLLQETFTVDEEEWATPEIRAILENAPSVTPVRTEAIQEWIPIKYHEITESERKENGYPKDWVYFLDCEMPQDEQEILVQAKNGEIRWDVCYEDDGFSLDSGWDWNDDIIAWMPLPEPYKGGDDE